jgi:hypothetical protein
MRFRPALIPSVSIALAIFGAHPGDLRAQPQTEVKIRLMSDALTARDRGDFAAAKAKLEALQAIAPNDPNVRRVLAEVTARLEAQLAAPPPAPSLSPAPIGAAVASPAPVDVAAPTASVAPRDVQTAPPAPAPVAPVQVLMPAVHDEKPDAPVAPEAGPKEKLSPEAMAAETAAEALLHADDNRLGTLVAYVQAQRALARTQARDKNYAAAIATLDAALEELEKPANELKEERDEYVREAKEAERAKQGVRLRHHR